VDALGINLGFFIAQLVNFGLLFFLLARFVWPRVTDLLDERAERIARGLEDARAAEEARENAERERDKLLAQARSDGQKALEEARQRGEEQGEQLVVEARNEAESIRQQARTQAEEERNRILSDTRQQVIAMAMAAAQQVLGESLADEKRAHATIAGFFAAVPPEAKNLGDDVTVISALPLTDGELAEVKKATGASTIDNKVEPAILGGVILRAGDKVVDGSVRGDLSSLAGQLR
jgi:F-type H+-transporting ATPase subunit b